MTQLHVAVGVIRNAGGEVLVSRRHSDAHQGGLWEFPGGKVEAGEAVYAALRRELREELNICVEQAAPLIQIPHDYGDRRVFLDVWEVTRFSGTPQALEGQPLQWLMPEHLRTLAFPAANRPIVTAVRLPRRYAILESGSIDAARRDFQAIIGHGSRLVQFRLKGLTANERCTFIEESLPLCRLHGISALLNSSIEGRYNADGIHLTAADLSASSRRPSGYSWVAASCHNLAELLQAQRIGADFAVLAPVAATTTHPGCAALGWDKFAAWVAQVAIPVFALGGMCAGDAPRAVAAGAQGIAGIRLFRDQ